MPYLLEVTSFPYQTSIRVMGKDELHIEFNYQDEYQKAISLAEQIATKNEERMVG